MAIRVDDLQTTEVVLQTAMTLIGGARWRLTLDQFCQRLGAERDDYWKEKFIQWAALSEALSQFDAHTLALLCVQERTPRTNRRRVCVVCHAEDGEHDWEVHSAELHARGED